MISTCAVDALIFPQVCVRVAPAAVTVSASSVTIAVQDSLELTRTFAVMVAAT